MRRYFFRQAWQNLSQNPWINVITLGTITVSFLVLGLFLVIFLNAQELMAEWGRRIRVTAYLADSVSGERVRHLTEKVRGFEEVQEVQYRSKDEALRILEERLQGQRGMLKGLPRNPLPASLEIRLKPEYRNSPGVNKLVEKLRGAKAIADL